MDTEDPPPSELCLICLQSWNPDQDLVCPTCQKKKEKMSKKKPDSRIDLGRGHVEINDESIIYCGNWPYCEDGDELVIMHKSDLEFIIQADHNALLARPYQMKPGFYQKTMENLGLGEYYEGPPVFVDELIFTAGDSTEHKLFLDRHFYSNNVKDGVWVRYVSVDQSFIEEGPSPPNGGPRDEDGL